MTDMKTADVVELLIGQHMQIRDLFDAVATASGKAREEKFTELVRMLAVHETAEELVVHPEARRALEGGDGVVEDRLVEERQAKEVLQRLDSMDTASPEFPGLLEELRVAVLEHASYEERYEFRYLRRALDPERLAQMADAVRLAESMAPTHPHPGTESAKANLAVGPILGLYDRTKDAVREMLSRRD